MKDSWSLEWIRAQLLQEEFRRKELTAAAGEGGGSAYGMKGFKGRGSKKGKAKEGSGGEQYSGGKRGNKGARTVGASVGSKGVHGAMGEGMGSEEGDGGAGGHGGMFYHVGEACSEDMVVPASKVALHRSSQWVIDTGAFMAMTNREDLLDEFGPSKAATVVSATGQVVPVRGEGRAMFMGADGRLVGLKRVLLVPRLCANLLSTKALSETGMKMEMMGTKVFKATLDGRVLWDLQGSKDMHRSMWEIPELPWKEAAARLAAEAVRRGHASHITSGGGGDGSYSGQLVHGEGALPSVTPSTEPLGAVSTIFAPEERGGRVAGGSGEAQAQGQPRDSAMAPMQPSLGPPRDEPRVFGLDKFNGDNFAEWSFKMVMEGTEKCLENDPEKSPWVWKSAQGYLLLGQALGSSQIRHIKPFQREPEKGPKAWAALKGVHAPATAAVAVVLERQMAALRIEEDKAVEEGVQKFFDLLTRLEGAEMQQTSKNSMKNLS
ncbi:unnamed protein product [Closterium sp. NIES-53]